MTVSCSRDQVSANIFEIIIASEKANHLVELVGNFWIGACARFIRDRMMGVQRGMRCAKGGVFLRGVSGRKAWGGIDPHGNALSMMVMVMIMDMVRLSCINPLYT